MCVELKVNPNSTINACSSRTKQSDTTPLFLACYGGHFRTVQVLLRMLFETFEDDEQQLQDHVDVVQQSGTCTETAIRLVPDSSVFFSSKTHIYVSCVLCVG